MVKCLDRIIKPSELPVMIYNNKIKFCVSGYSNEEGGFISLPPSKPQKIN